MSNLDVIRSKYDNELNGTTKARNKISISPIQAGFNKWISSKNNSLNSKKRLIEQFRTNAIYMLGVTLKASIRDSHNKSQIYEKFSANKINNFERCYGIIRHNYPLIFSEFKKLYALSGFQLRNFASNIESNSKYSSKIATKKRKKSKRKKKF